jgi:nitric oxide dioxygenase
VGAALLWTLEKGLGPAWNNDIKAAWTETYVTLANVMKNAAAEQTEAA